ncbi:hypothetical protein D3C73_1492450 [compost metagenome]
MKRSKVSLNLQIDHEFGLPFPVYGDFSPAFCFGYAKPGNAAIRAANTAFGGVDLVQYIINGFAGSLPEPSDQPVLLEHGDSRLLDQ